MGKQIVLLKKSDTEKSRHKTKSEKTHFEKCFSTGTLKQKNEDRGGKKPEREKAKTVNDLVRDLEKREVPLFE